MKVGILTYYFVHNYGAVLQAYGMQRVLERLGHDASFLTFNRNYDHMRVGADKKYNISLKSVPMLTQYFLANGAGTFYYNFQKRNKLHAFVNNRLKMGVRYSDADANAVLIGSDEVFSIDVGLNPFLYGHDIPVKNIFSYAASFGSTRMEDIEKSGCREIIESGLMKLKNIGVRDITTENIVREISKRETSLNCDPVLLYGFKDELQKEKLPKTKDKYIVVYSYDSNFNDARDVESIKLFAKKNNLKIWSVGYYHKWCDKNIMCSPTEILGYFSNSEMVVTDTFHGSVLSIITNTPLMVRLKKKNQKVEFLLAQYGLKDRLTCEIDDIESKFNKRIDYKKVNEIVEEEREKSIMYLKECLAD